MKSVIRLKAGFGAAFSLLLGIGAAAVIRTYSWETSVAWVSHTFEVLGHLDALSKEANELETAAVALESGPTVSDVERFRGLLRDATARSAEIHRLTTDYPFEEKNSIELGRLVAERRAAFEKALSTETESIRAGLLRTENKSGSAARIIGVLYIMQAEERRLLGIRMARQQEIGDSARTLFELAFALSFLLTLLAFIRSVLDGRRRTAAEKALAAREEQYRQVVEMASDMIFRADSLGRFTFWNESVLSMLHFTEREVIARSYLKLVRQDKRKEVERFYLRQFVSRTLNTYFEFPLIDGHGHERWVGLNVQLLMNNGKVTGFQGIAREITKRKRAEHELQKSRTFVERIAATTPGILYVYDMEERRNIFSNREVTSVLGYRPEEMEDCMGHAGRYFHPDDTAALRLHYEALRHAMDGEVRRIEYRARHADGHWVWLASRDTPFERNSAGKVQRIVGIAQDITARKATQEKLAYQANYDALTGLANRHHFATRLEGVLRRAAMEHALASLCILDVDRFKETNDRFGHSAGDEVLEAVGNIMRAELGDEAFAGRLGGDEFSIVLPETDGDQAAGIAERIRSRLGELSFEGSGGARFTVTATFGVAEWQPSMGARELLEAADRALYRAKIAGRNQVCVEV